MEKSLCVQRGREVSLLRKEKYAPDLQSDKPWPPSLLSSVNYRTNFRDATLVGLFRVKDGEDLTEDPEEDKGKSSDQKPPEEALLKRLEAMGDDGQLVIHVAGKRQGKGLSSNHHVPSHHEDPEEHQKQGRDGPPDG